MPHAKPRRALTSRAAVSPWAPGACSPRGERAVVDRQARQSISGRGVRNAARPHKCVTAGGGESGLAGAEGRSPWGNCALAGHAMLWSVVAFYLQTEVESDWSNSAACLMPQYCLSGTYLASASEHHISITYQGVASMSHRLTTCSRGQG